MTLTRRELFERAGALTIASGLASLPGTSATVDPKRVAAPLDTPPPAQVEGTEPLTTQADFGAKMVEGIHRFLIQQTAASVETRQALWNRDYSSNEAYASSLAPNRERFGKAIGLIDERIPYIVPSLEVMLGASPIVASAEGYKVYGVRWPVLNNVDGEGFLLEPLGPPIARVVALPDADWSPEMLTGLSAGISPQAQFARRLAENGCLVLVPAVIDRKDTWSGNKEVARLTNLTHREYIYRMAYEMGRHIIGYEVQKVLAAVDWFSQSSPPLPVGVMGYGEGGLLALYSAAVDTRINAACVSGYFASRQDLWQEPLYRNVWTLLHEFGDAELAGLIAPRALIVEASQGPQISGPPPAIEGHTNAVASGRLISPQLPDVRAEAQRAQVYFQKLGIADRLSLIVSGNGQGEPGSEQAIHAFLQSLGSRSHPKPLGNAPRDMRAGFDPSVRLHRQFEEVVDFTQKAVIESESVRGKFWAKADDSSVEQWQESTQPYRWYLSEEIYGKLDEPSGAMAVQTRKIYDKENWTGYEVMLPLWPDVFAYGILLAPRAMEPNERRPVVVCQHGLEGRPQDLIVGDTPALQHYYHRFAADLADHGFVVYCPQNPYIGGERFRTIQRLANPLKLSLFSFILRQHERTLDWLATLPFIDPKRIGFYGHSYGGKTAVHIPPLLDKYALSICSGDFNEWIWKTSRDDVPFTYVFTEEYDVLEFNLGNTFNHADMARLMTPRPFMVERGHDDDVSVDSWVAYEYAKVRRHYDLLGLHDQTRIEYFNGPHTIHGVGTFEFLHNHLDWGEPYHW